MERLYMTFEDWGGITIALLGLLIVSSGFRRFVGAVLHITVEILLCLTGASIIGSIVDDRSSDR